MVLGGIERRRIDLRRASGRVLRGAAIGVRLRGDQPRLQAIVRDGIL